MPTGYHIQVENSAPSQSRPAQSVMWAAPLLANLGAESVLDLGCGRLRNLEALREHFVRVTLVDTRLQCARIIDRVPKLQKIRLLPIEGLVDDRSTYDAVFLIAVLHVVDRPAVRRKLLTLAKSKLHTNGFLVVDVPSGVNYYRSHCTRENRHGDGYVMGKGITRTFYKNYSADELDALVLACRGFVLHAKHAFDHHIVRIWQKSGTTKPSQ